MRAPKNIPLPANLIPDEPPLKAGEVRQVRQYRLITPLFGGGVEPGVADPVTIIRGTTIRGQLRFWWRATRGGVPEEQLRERPWSDDDIRKNMKEREVAIWGAASLPKQPAVSQVQVEVSIQNNGKAIQAFTVTRNQKGNKRIDADRDVPAYASFPLQPEYRTAAPGMDTKKVVFDIVFTLTLSYPSACQTDVAAALWAWETFGGVGGRTRRGFGALQLMSVDDTQVDPPKPKEVKQIIEDGLKTHVVAGSNWPQNVPHLNQLVRQIKIVPRPSDKQQWDEIDSWFDLIKALADFRQERYDSTKSTKHPGRSKWPEPDAIRRATKRASGDHKQPRSMLDKAPRAIFGLPIVFHFKDDDDPGDTILQGTTFERLGSPLILRPLACADDEGVGIAVVLQTLPRLPGDLVLKDAKTGTEHKHLSITDVFLDVKEAAIIAPLNKQADVLQAFLDSL
jgi:CRISPR-associated protein Cmr1